MNKSSASIKEIEEKAMRGEDVSEYFGEPQRRAPLEDTKLRRIQRVNVDFTEPMLKELDEMAVAMNISRQALIKMFVRRGIDEHYMATSRSA